MKYILILLTAVSLMSCSKEPQAIIYNEDNCSYCRMTISDQRYGSEIITSRGKVYKFDSNECMAAYTLTDKSLAQYHSIWTVDFNNPEHFIDAEKAWFLHSDLLKSPMGLNFSAFGSIETAQTVKNVYPGTIIQWNELKEIVNNDWLKEDK